MDFINSGNLGEFGNSNMTSSEGLPPDHDPPLLSHKQGIVGAAAGTRIEYMRDEEALTCTK